MSHGTHYVYLSRITVDRAKLTADWPHEYIQVALLYLTKQPLSLGRNHYSIDVLDCHPTNILLFTMGRSMFQLLWIKTGRGKKMFLIICGREWQLLTPILYIHLLGTEGCIRGNCEFIESAISPLHLLNKPTQVTLIFRSSSLCL